MIFPNDASPSLKAGMPGTDAAGAAGFRDWVNQHLIRTGVQLSRIRDVGRDVGRGFAGPSAGTVLGAAVGQAGHVRPGPRA